MQIPDVWFFSFVSFSYIHSFIHSVVLLRQVHSLFHSGFSTEFRLVFPLSIYSILSFPSGQWVLHYVFFLFFPSILPFLSSNLPSIMCFRRRLLHKMWRINLVFLLLFLGHLCIDPLNAELHPICHFLALLRGHPILLVSRIRVKYEYTYIICSMFQKCLIS